jgi:hypothetical protein
MIRVNLVNKVEKIRYPTDLDKQHEDKYDTVMTYCPSCYVRIEVRIPHSAGKNEFFQFVNMPERIAKYLDGRKVHCNHCKNTIIVEKESKTTKPTFVLKIDCSQITPGMESWYDDAIPKSNEE